MTTLRNLLDILRAHADRLPHMLDKPVVVIGLGDETPLANMSIGTDAHNNRLHFELPVVALKPPEPTPEQPKPEPRLRTMRGDVE